MPVYAKSISEWHQPRYRSQIWAASIDRYNRDQDNEKSKKKVDTGCSKLHAPKRFSRPMRIYLHAHFLNAS
jgi:hypothetical protein